MHILCAICSDLVNQAESIFVTKCGHIFHQHCLSQWLERSKSCPQCRNKVTDKCMFRMYPTVSNENNSEDAATLQSRLDNAQLELRQHKESCKKKDDKLTAVTADLKTKEEMLKACEKKLVTKESAVSALKDQLEYVKIQNKETHRLREENEMLKKNIQTLNGLQKVLNATVNDVEQMLDTYTDVRTIATFATALKRALCESELKKNESRDKLQIVKQELANEKNKSQWQSSRIKLLEERLSTLQQKYNSFKAKRKASDLTDNTETTPVTAVKQFKANDSTKIQEDLNNAICMENSNSSFNTLLNKIENSDSPYLSLKHSNMALTALQRTKSDPKMKPSEMAFVAKNITVRKPDFNNSIFKTSNKKISLHDEVMNRIQNHSPIKENKLNVRLDVSYDGLGGHSKIDTFPVPKPMLKNCLPKLTSKHRLKRPSGTQDISKLLTKISDDSQS